MTDPAARRDELAAGLTAVRRRIAAACAESGRAPDEVELVVVTKLFPASDVRLLADLGVSQVGENRDQEAREKLTDPLLADTRLTRHFIGQLQTNKAGSVVSYADVVHTVDRRRLVDALQSAADRAHRRPRVLVQVSLDDDAGAAGRGGAPAELGGLMAVAPVDGDPDEAFQRLAGVAERLRESHPGATWVSAGMSGDLEVAIRHGATHLRVGSAILGSRPALR